MKMVMNSCKIFIIFVLARSTITNVTRIPWTTIVCFSVVTVNDEHGRPEFKIKRWVKFKEGSGLKAPGIFVIFLKRSIHYPFN